tara:strand:+ start:122 stop:397 length:276 start_codon:yes stop_codon:yes gene_type:complete
MRKIAADRNYEIMKIAEASDDCSCSQEIRNLEDKLDTILMRTTMILGLQAGADEITKEQRDQLKPLVEQYLKQEMGDYFRNLRDTMGLPNE